MSFLINIIANICRKVNSFLEHNLGTALYSTITHQNRKYILKNVLYPFYKKDLEWGYQVIIESESLYNKIYTKLKGGYLDGKNRYFKNGKNGKN